MQAGQQAEEGSGRRRTVTISGDGRAADRGGAGRAHATSAELAAAVPKRQRSAPPARLGLLRAGSMGEGSASPRRIRTSTAGAVGKPPAIGPESFEILSTLG